jgi:RNA polymerase sigma factor (sigma-70 family)
MSSIYPMLHRIKALLMRRGTDAHDAEDIVHEAYLRFVSYDHDGQSVRKPMAFLTRVSTNLAIDVERRRRRVGGHLTLADAEHVVDPAPTPEAIAEGRQRLARLQDGFMRLDDRTRSMIWAQRIDGWTIAQIAAHESLTVSAVEKRLARGLASLVRYMND